MDLEDVCFYQDKFLSRREAIMTEVAKANAVEEVEEVRQILRIMHLALLSCDRKIILVKACLYLTKKPCGT